MLLFKLFDFLIKLFMYILFGELGVLEFEIINI